MDLNLFFAKTLLPNGTELEKQRLASLLHLYLQGHLCVKESAEFSPTLPLVRDGDRIYLQKNWVYESTILHHLQRLQKSPPLSLFDLSLFHEHLQNTTLLPEQKQALTQATRAPFFILCGGPGTGKTYTAVQYIRLLAASLHKGERLHLAICAPTGKAAMHLFKTLLAAGDLPPSIRIEAVTLHRLLKLQPGKNNLFSKRKIDADLILIDEASMIDVPLLAHLLEATRDGSRLFLMGDPDQLPPVENVSLFPELASLFGITLQQCIRTQEGPLTKLSAAIRRAALEEILPHFPPLNWPFDETLPKRLFEKIQPIASDEKPDPRACLTHYSSFQVLNALRQGPFGTGQLNRQIAYLADKQPGKWQAFPILITANDPHSNLYNGTTGILLRQNRIPIAAYFPGKLEPITHLPPFEIAFCLSIYKSQGSEFDEVLALFPKGSENFGRETLYTAITRAKTKFQWIGEEETLRKMALSSQQKVSGLKERIAQE